MYQEYLNQLQVSVAPLPSDQLKDLLNNDNKLDEKVDEVLESLKKKKNNLLGENRNKAEENIEKEPQIVELRGKIHELYEERRMRCVSAHEKLALIKSKPGSVSQETGLALLQTAAAESEDNSDKLVKNFTDNEINLESILDTFLSARKTMHLRKLKAEKMIELMRQQQLPQNNRGSTYNNLTLSGFYPSSQQITHFGGPGLPTTTVPYPLGPTMPMPRPY